MKIRLWIKWRIARKKVLKRYRELSITEPPEYIEGEGSDQYTERVIKYMFFLFRLNRLGNIAFNHILKEREFLEKAYKTINLIAVLWFCFLICWYIVEFLR